MKKFIIILGIILTSGIAALALSTNNNNTEVKTAEIKNDRKELSNTKGHEFGNFKSDIANAD
jgi:hypothetical protein